MSAPEPDMNRQVKRHKGPLLGFIAILVFVSVLIVWWLGREIDEAEAPAGPDAPLDGTATSAPGPGDQTGTQTDGVSPADQGIATTPAQNPAAESPADVNPSEQDPAPPAD
jgi:hypothetical protein